MLAKVFNVFETTEIQLTPQAINRLRFSALMSIPAMPLFAAAEFLNFSESVNKVLIALGVICALALLYCFFTRMANRLWIPEKYLDEVEIDRKRRSASLTYQLLVIGLMVSLTIMLLLTGAEKNSATLLSPRMFIFFLGSLMCVSMGVQTAIAAWMTEPLSHGKVDKVASDGRYKWVVLLIILTVGFFGYFIGAFG